MDFNLAALLALISGTIIGYLSKIWRWAVWSVSIPLDIMYILIQENNRKKGKNIKFLEDKVDPLNPTQDSGILINHSWVASYNITQRKEDSSSFSFFGGDNTPNLTYSISCFRLFRQKLLDMIDKSMIGKSSERTNKIFIVNSSSVYFVGEINEDHLDIPRVIEEKLDGNRKTRLNIFLHGVIGTGKTTMARAIAQKLDMPIYILAINSWWDITDFVKALQRIPDDSVILLDDIDLVLEQVLRASIDKNNSPIPLKFSTASIMAFLDGIFMKEKRWIVIMCTNRPEQVKRLLRLRPGRVHINFECTDVHINDYIEATQEAKKLIDEFKKEKDEAKPEEPKEVKPV
jgi:adenylate kinase family enzyme